MSWQTATLAGTRHMIWGGQLALLMLSATAAGGRAQVPGSWDPGFNHEIDPASPHVVNDYLDPFRDPVGTTTPQFVPPPVPPAVGTNATANFYWGQGNPFGPMQMQAFNAIHMALIPKGPHQGKVMVWGAWYPVKLTPNSTLEPQGRPWYFQPWAIIDPVNPGERFRNYLLPLRAVGTPLGFAPPSPDPSPQDPTPELISILFCTGHAWTQEGDLVVAGGATSWVAPYVPPRPLAGNGGGAKFLFLFDPSVTSQGFGPQLQPLYPTELGHWQRQPDLLLDRFYPTVTLTQPLSRLSPSREIVMIAGGTNDDDPWAPTTYETYTPGSLSTFTGVSIRRDPDPSPTATVLLDGPRYQGASEPLEEYPRLHVLRDGTALLSGPLHPASTVQQDQAAVSVALSPPPPAPLFARPWSQSARNQLPPWTLQRHDGASLIASFNNLVSGFDIVVRLGGGTEDLGVPGATSTDTSEYLVVPSASSNWGSLGTMPGGPRQWPNAVVLPDASILVIGGGDNQTGEYTKTTALWRPGFGWEKTDAETPTRRAYHSCAVLLPDGRVFVGGGELVSPQAQATALAPAEHDYDIYVPHYLQGNPTRPSIQAFSDLNSFDPLPYDEDMRAYSIASGADIVIDCDVPPGATIDRVVLMAPGSITHHSDMSARYVQLATSSLSANKIKAHVPQGGSLPRGFYMCFAVTNSGIPSVARWVKVT